MIAPPMTITAPPVMMQGHHTQHIMHGGAMHQGGITYGAPAEPVAGGMMMGGAVHHMGGATYGGGTIMGGGQMMAGGGAMNYGQFDVSGDGQISMQEFQNNGIGGMQAFQMADANHDGVIDRQEFSAAMQHMQH